MSESTLDPRKDATEHTAERNRKALPAFDPGDVERASRGRLAQIPDGIIDGPFGRAWDMTGYEFIVAGSSNPDTVNPSLWRQAQLNNEHGLFEVDRGLYQVRGYDISNVTFIESATGWIVIDPLTAEATARAALKLVNDTLGERPVVAVIYTHSHVDHFGGVLGVIDEATVAAGACPIIAPEHFLDEAVAENVLAGYAMARRAMYQFGIFLPRGPKGQLDCGLGKAIPLASGDLVPPTIEIDVDGQELVVDGVRIVFQLTPHAEAPAEMNFFFPERGWLCLAENCTHNMHNLIPIRGAQVRDALAWSTYIDDALDRFGADTTLMFASHHQPRWGTEDVGVFLSRQRDLYRWMHDQTLRLANHGMVPTEIAEALTLPEQFASHADTTGYYGSLVHNVKAVYQRYLSWYDGNPAHLHELPPEDAGARYVELAGGSDRLLDHARAAFDAGDYRWVAQVVNHLVFAEPDNDEARQLQADALEQLGYQAESATFRNAYLLGAQELRNGPGPSYPTTKTGWAASLPVEHLLRTSAMRLRADVVGSLDLRLNLDVTDVGERWLVGMSNGALRYRADRSDSQSPTLRCSREVLVALLFGDRTLGEAVANGDVSVDGELDDVAPFLDHLDLFPTNFPVVEP